MCCFPQSFSHTSPFFIFPKISMFLSNSWAILDNFIICVSIEYLTFNHCCFSSSKPHASHYKISYFSLILIFTSATLNLRWNISGASSLIIFMLLGCTYFLQLWIVLTLPILQWVILYAFLYFLHNPSFCHTSYNFKSNITSNLLQ